MSRRVKSPLIPAKRMLQDRQLSSTIVMAIAAACAALIAIVGDRESFSALTVTFALVGLLPWALEAGGVRLAPMVFFGMTFAPAAVIVLVDRNPGGMFPVLIALVWLIQNGAGIAMTVLSVGSAAGLAVGLAVIERTTHETGTIYFLGGVGVACLAGNMLRRQELLMEELRDAHRQQSEHAAAAERTHIAREVHDVVAHSLTITMLHVTGARRVITSDPARAAQALEQAETVGRESLDSIRQVVGLLRSDTSVATGGHGDAAVPLPRLGDIPGLIHQFRQAGLTVSADVDLDDVVTDPTTALTAFRVVQEALSNVLQYAPEAPLQLQIRRDDGGTVLRITAENPTVAGDQSRSDRTGLGLRGMAERVRAAGGSVEAGVTDRQTWRIDAVLPLRGAAVTA